MAIMKLSSPWMIFYREVEAMFRHDKDVHVVFDEAGDILNIYVDDSLKAAAL